MPKTPRIVLESTYRASDRDRAWRIIENSHGLQVEVEHERDGMGGIVWRGNNDFNALCSVGGSILRQLVEMAGLLKEAEPDQ